MTSHPVMESYKDGLPPTGTCRNFIVSIMVQNEGQIVQKEEGTAQRVKKGEGIRPRETEKIG